jgi:23S rRNA pseudouridine1911/1915/1917 synthase
MSYYDPITWTVTEAEDGWPLRRVLKDRLRLSRRLMSRLKRAERGITVNGVRQYTDCRVKAGDVVAIRMEEEVSEDILPEPLPLDILYEDDHLLVLNKPPGLIVHPTHGHYTGTLANGVVHYWRSKGERHRFRPVHRLDQETSGVLAVAKNPYAHQRIAEQMIAKAVDKRYAAIVHGVPRPAAGTVNAPIARDPAAPHIRIVTPDGQEAVTHYETVQPLNQAAWVSLVLETGRTHQIRVHMKHIGHPLVGDRMYGDPASDERLAPVIARQALHAERLKFEHPVTLRPMEFIAPWPEDMRALRTRLAKEDDGSWG